MFKNIATLISVALALVGGTHATQNVYDTTAVGTGAYIGVATYSKGFNARFFEYPEADLIRYFSNDYVAGNYALQAPFTSTTGVTEPNFSYGWQPRHESIYDMLNINMYNVNVELKGYFVAPESGLYNVRINNVNDGGWIWLGAGAFDTCSQNSLGNTYDDLLLGVRGAGNAYSSYIYLDEGAMYPMRTNYINIYFNAVFQFEIVTPSGKVITNFEDTVINFDKKDVEACISAQYGQIVKTSSTIAFGDEYETPSTTYYPTESEGQTLLVEQVYYSAPASTVTENLSNTFATTSVGTAITTVNGVATPVAVVINQESVPIEQLTSTTKAAQPTITSMGKTVPQATGCSLNEDLMKKYPGFHATIHTYDNCFGFLEATYFGNDYTTESVIGTGANITSPNFSVHAYLWQTDTIYGAELVSWKGYVAQLTGYIYAKESGLYQFNIDYSDDGSMVWIGTNDAFSCCQPDTIPYDTNDAALIFAKDQEMVGGFVYLTEGNYYPIRVVLVNWYGDSVLQMSMITPSGNYIKDDWSNWVYSVEDTQDGFCKA
jgi:sporulation protein YlmC with PRC-barrel domain